VTVENGYAPYPEGPARNPTSMERGSVMFISSYIGDPTTPGYPAYKDAKREMPTNIPKIPSLPISFHAAERLLEEIDGIYSGFSADGSKRKLSGKTSSARVRMVNHGARDCMHIQ
jgi:N-acetylated-alpha-linked acidic dipeptidase